MSYRRRLMMSDGNIIGFIYQTTSTDESVKLYHTNKGDAIRKITIAEDNYINSTPSSTEFNFTYTFKNIGLHVVQFEFGTSADGLRDTFRFCTKLIAVLGPVFSQYTYSFRQTFLACTNLKYVSENIFKNSINAVDFESCFSSCSSLEIIPEKLFANNTKATNFSACFSGCKAIQSIPENLFKNNTVKETMISTFSGCSSIRNIPENLFFNGGRFITDVSNCFDNCTSLTKIPSHIFDENIRITKFNSAFNNCINITGNTPNQSNGQTLELWERAGRSNFPVSIDGTECFAGCTKLTNYNNIPTNWK